MRFSIFILNLPKNNVGGAINLSIKSKRPKKMTCMWNLTNERHLIIEPGV